MQAFVLFKLCCVSWTNKPRPFSLDGALMQFCCARDHAISLPLFLSPRILDRICSTTPRHTIVVACWTREHSTE